MITTDNGLILVLALPFLGFALALVCYLVFRFLDGWMTALLEYSE